jgi:hydroxymethylbilane synthase
MSTTKNHLIIGSRGSDLALWQAHHVQALLGKSTPQITTEIKIIHTIGDQVLDTSLSLMGGKGVFTKEIEYALVSKEIDLAVHSMKDLPTVVDPSLTIAAIPERGFVEDVFMTKHGKTPLAEVRQGGVIATGSLRRKAQLLHLRPDLTIIDIRGNVPTRIKKLLASDWDGMILARAGVQRLGLTEHISHPITLEWMLPAVGQGALALQVRTDDTFANEIVRKLDDPMTHATVVAERALLMQMGGGCQVPIGAHATISGGMLDLRGIVAHPQGESVVKAEKTGSISDAEQIGASLGRTLLDQGGKAILDFVDHLAKAREFETLGNES